MYIIYPIIYASIDYTHIKSSETNEKLVKASLILHLKSDGSVEGKIVQVCWIIDDGYVATRLSS